MPDIYPVYGHLIVIALNWPSVGQKAEFCAFNPFDKRPTGELSFFSSGTLVYLVFSIRFPPLMSKIASRNFKGARVALDNVQFEGCSFEGCTLIYAGGELPSFVGCSFSNVKFMLDGAAARTAAYVRMTLKAGASNVVRDWLPELFLSNSQH